MDGGREGCDRGSILKQDGLDEERKRVKGEKVRMVANDHKAIIEQRSSFFSHVFLFLVEPKTAPCFFRNFSRGGKVPSHEADQLGTSDSTQR